jgi:hypothetical protein
MTRRWLQIKCALCEKKIVSRERGKVIEELIDGTNYTFDNPDCLLVFKNSELYTETTCSASHAMPQLFFIYSEMFRTTMQFQPKSLPRRLLI